MGAKNKKLLFVDDDTQIITLLQRQFAVVEWDVFYATSGEQGLSILSNQKINLVITDINMPHMDGITFLKKVRKQYPDTIRFVMSGSANDTIVGKAVKSGCVQQVLPKPWDTMQLKETIQLALQ